MSQERPFGPPEDPDKFDDWEECIAWATGEGYTQEEAERICGDWKDETENDAMTDDTTDPEYRAVYQPDPAQVHLRDVDADDDGLFAVRMPIASTGDVRNEGDEPLSRDELSGMATQINEGDVGVFLSHGRSFEISDARYGQTERLGSWQEAEVTTPEEREDGQENLLEATAVMADPETLPAATGRYRETLAILKEQADRGIPMSSSIGWRDDDSAPGGNDLMEASIVGIPADPRTNNTKAMARAAVDAGADPEAFLREVEDAVMGADTEHDHTTEHMSDSDDDPPETVEHEGRTYELREQGDTTDDEQNAEEDERQDGPPEWAEQMLDLQREANDTLGEVADAIREDDDDEDDEDDDDEENAAEHSADDLREHLSALREGGVDVDDIDIPEPDDEQDTDDTDDTETDTTVSATKELIR